LAAGQEVHMDVENRLSAFGVDVHNETVTAFGDSLVGGQFAGGGDHILQDSQLGLGDLSDVAVVGLGDQKDVDGGLRMEIGKG